MGRTHTRLIYPTWDLKVRDKLVEEKKKTITSCPSALLIIFKSPRLEISPVPVSEAIYSDSEVSIISWSKLAGTPSL